MSYWLVKQEPEDYSWADFNKDGKSAWTGVRNYLARNNLRAMKVDDSVLFYHSGEAKEIVGLAKVKKLAYPDPTAEEGDWSAVDLVPIKPLSRTIPLAEIKGHATLKEMVIARNSRLSVSAVTEGEFKTILKLSGTNL